MDCNHWKSKYTLSPPLVWGRVLYHNRKGTNSYPGVSALSLWGAAPSPLLSWSTVTELETEKKKVYKEKNLSGVTIDKQSGDSAAASSQGRQRRHLPAPQPNKPTLPKLPGGKFCPTSQWGTRKDYSMEDREPVFLSQCRGLFSLAKSPLSGNQALLLIPVCWIQ